MVEKQLSNTAIFKALLWIWLFSFLLLLLVIGLVYGSNMYFGVPVVFESILFYVLLSFLLLILPLLSKIRISHKISKKTLLAAVIDKPELTKQEWRVFFVWHLLLIVFLFVIFVFCRPYLFMLHDFFGDGRKNPAVAVFIIAVLGLQHIACLVHNKITTGDCFDEKHPQLVMERRFDIASAIMLASAVIMFISWVSMMMIARNLSL
jgi:hypothetical protein